MGSRMLRWLAGATLGLAACVVALAVLADARPGSIDDAFVLLVYVRHFAEHGALYYNAADGPVDGFTSLLDLLLKAAGVRILRGDPISIAWWVTVASYLGAVAVGSAALLRLAARPADRLAPAVVVLGVLALATAPGLAEGAAYLLGTPLLVLVLLGVCRFLGEEEREGAGRATLGVVLLFATCLARPEGVPLAGVLGGAWWLERRRAGLVRPGAPPALLAGLLVATLLWRLALFGHWAPNAYYAKTSDVRWHEVRHGAAYLARFAATPRGAIVLTLAAANAVAAGFGGWREAAARRRQAALALAALVSLASVVVSGGDSYLGARFLAPAAVLTLVAATRAAIDLRGAVRLGFAVALALLATSGVSAALRDAPAKLRAIAAGAMSAADFPCNRAIAERLRALGPDVRLAQHDAQWIKYFADELYVLDTSGLNSATVAHLPVDDPLYFAKDGIEVALELGIEVLHCDYRWTSPEAIADHSLGTVLADPELGRRFLGRVYAGRIAETLRAFYLPASLTGVCGGQAFNVLVRADAAPELEHVGFRIGPP